MLDDMDSNFNTAIIVAAGSGSRLASKTPKQFLELRGVELLSYSVNSFLSHPLIHDVLIVTSTDFLKHVRRQYPNCQVVPGGSTRQDSVFNGLEACNNKTTHVLVHDAARPLLPERVISECLGMLETYDGVAPAVTPVDSMVEIEGDTFRNLNRENLRIIQTPQCFRVNVLKSAHATGNVDTDELGLVKQSLPEAKLTLIEGAPETMKVTHPADLTLIDLYLRAK